MGINLASVLNASHVAWLQGFGAGIATGIAGILVLALLLWLIYDKFFQR